MFVLISQRHDQNKHGSWINNLEQEYIHYFSQYGITLIPVPNNPTVVEQYFQLPIEGIILSGGNDICPSSYGEDILWPGSSPQRDETERRMLELAVERKLPVWGICRGMQFINVFFGGTLMRDINKERPIHSPRENHLITIKDDYFKKILGSQSVVNSYHNQAVTIKTFAPSLRIFALSEKDGIIEGIYHPQLPIAGVQWHPERKSPDEEFNRRLVEAFVKKELFWKRKE